MEQKDTGSEISNAANLQDNPQGEPYAHEPNPQGQPYAQAPNPQGQPYAQAPNPQGQPYAHEPNPQGQPYAQAPNPQGQPYAQAPNPQGQPYAQTPNPQGQPPYGYYVAPPVPQEIRRWNWGAFAFNWLWGCGNGAYLALLCLIPVFGWFVWPFFCGALGNTWAWKSGKFKDVDTFLTVQKTWNIAGIIYFIIILVMIILEIMSFAFLFALPWDNMIDNIDSYTDYGNFGSDMLGSILSGR
ncbi:MAG: hypothetical protein LBG82_07285 [Clostridiales Family XIII bacterium]|jgi:hypothetical protein|nr:hypothetical protein [Clostridiales Family XIII bacterium]